MLINFISKFYTSLGLRLLILYQFHLSLHLRMSFTLSLSPLTVSDYFPKYIPQILQFNIFIIHRINRRGSVMVEEICHFAYIDRESPKYLSTVDERFCNISVIPCHTYHSHVWVFCLPHLHFS